MSQSTFCAKIHDAFIKHPSHIRFGRYEDNNCPAKEEFIIANLREFGRRVGTMVVDNLSGEGRQTLYATAYIPFTLPRGVDFNKPLDGEVDYFLNLKLSTEDICPSVFTDDKGRTAVMIECLAKFDTNFSDGQIEEVAAKFIKQIGGIVALQTDRCTIHFESERDYKLIKASGEGRAYLTVWALGQILADRDECSNLSLSISWRSLQHMPELGYTSECFQHLQVRRSKGGKDEILIPAKGVARRVSGY